MSDGPLWNYRIYDEVENCKATFWYFFFGVNNIFETNKLVIYKIGLIYSYFSNYKKVVQVYLLTHILVG